MVPANCWRKSSGAIDAADTRGCWNGWQLAAEGYELAHFCGELTRFVRDLMVAKSCGADSTLLQVPSDERASVGGLAKRFSEEDLLAFSNSSARRERMRYALVPRFHLELGLMKLVHARRLASLEVAGRRTRRLGSGGEAGQRRTARARQEPASSCAPRGSARAALRHCVSVDASHPSSGALLSRRVRTTPVRQPPASTSAELPRPATGPPRSAVVPCRSSVVIAGSGGCPAGRHQGQGLRESKLSG